MIPKILLAMRKNGFRTFFPNSGCVQSPYSGWAKKRHLISKCTEGGEVSPENLGFSEMSGNLILERFHLRKRLKMVLVNQIRHKMAQNRLKGAKNRWNGLKLSFWTEKGDFYRNSFSGVDIQSRWIIFSPLCKKNLNNPIFKYDDCWTEECEEQSVIRWRMTRLPG